MRRMISAAALAVAVGVAGCAQLRALSLPTDATGVPGVPETPGAGGSQDIGADAPVDGDRLLAYAAWLREQPAADVGRERERLRRALTARASDAQRLRYALALSVPAEPGPEPAKALEALEPVLRAQDSPNHALAVVLRGLLAELQRAQLEAQRAQADAQRAQAEAQRAQTEAQRAAAELQRSGAERAELQRKLDSLKALEKSLSEREGTAGPRPGRR